MSGPLGRVEEAYGTPILRLDSDSESTVHRVLFLGDLHWDHPGCDRDGLKRVLDRAVEQGAWIALLGDTFCAMQGTNDRRGHKSAIRPEHQRDDYFSALIETSVEWFMPYRDHLWLVLEGNHESAIKRHNEIDLVKHFVDGLGGNILTPGYSTYALVRMMRQGQYGTVPMWLAHGHGGGGEVTKGAIQAQRRAVTYPDAQVVVSGHIHNSYFIAHEQHRVSSSGKVKSAQQEHYVVSAWKDEFEGGKGGYHVEKGRGPVLPSGWMSEWKLSSRHGPRWRFVQARPDYW